MDVVEATELCVVLAVTIAVVALLAWIGRRRWLGNLGGTFECALRPRGRARFMLGVARYNGEYLEWFRAFSLALSPKLTLRQNRWEIEAVREPQGSDRPGLFGLDAVVALHSRSNEEPVELAMAPESSVGFRAWLESAPAGRGRYGHTAH